LKITIVCLKVFDVNKIMYSGLMISMKVDEKGKGANEADEINVQI
jgi:hypothetical protein